MSEAKIKELGTRAKTEKRIFKDRWKSRCEKYADLPTHNWERRGVVSYPFVTKTSLIHVVWQCLICEKAILEPLTPLTTPKEERIVKKE